MSQLASRLASHLGILFMHLLGVLPLAWVRTLGLVLGYALYLAVPSRRRVAQINLTLCFPELSSGQVSQRVRQTFVFFAQAWLDRGWLWHGSPSVLLRRLKLTGAVDVLATGNMQAQPIVIFSPHFVGLDAGWTALTQQIPRTFATIYTNQANPEVDQWILRGRSRFGKTQLFGRAAGVRPVVAALRDGDLLYLLPDMNFGPHESVFVPFYGVSAATVPSLSRFAKLGRAKVVPVVSRMTQQGYEIEVMTPWDNYPTDNLENDAARMNLRLQDMIDAMPAQYYWLHKRFKDRPCGEANLY
jgi:KDO2-lipid IV(A) lauroyltransferase